MTPSFRSKLFLLNAQRAFCVAVITGTGPSLLRVEDRFTADIAAFLRFKNTASRLLLQPQK